MARALLIVVVLFSAARMFADTNAVEEVIQKTCALYQGVEYPEARKVLRISQKQVSNQRKGEVIVLFTVEISRSANSSYQFLCALKSLEAPPGGTGLVYLQQIGARGVRFLDDVQQTTQGIEIAGHEYGPNDPMYKPTVPCHFLLKNANGLYSLERLRQDH